MNPNKAFIENYIVRELVPFLKQKQVPIRLLIVDKIYSIDAYFYRSFVDRKFLKTRNFLLEALCSYVHEEHNYLKEYTNPRYEKDALYTVLQNGFIVAHSTLFIEESKFDRQSNSRLIYDNIEKLGPEKILFLGDDNLEVLNFLNPLFDENTSIREAVVFDKTSSDLCFVNPINEEEKKALSEVLKANRI